MQDQSAESRPPIQEAGTSRAFIHLSSKRLMLRCSGKIGAETPEPSAILLGPLEISVLEILWSRGKCNVRDVARRLNRKLAYTTVMTTLDRLFKKGLLERQMLAKAYVYAPVLSRDQWHQRRTALFLIDFLADSRKNRDLFISSLLDWAIQQGTVVLNQLERKIQIKRRELGRGPDAEQPTLYDRG